MIAKIPCLLTKLSPRLHQLQYIIFIKNKLISWDDKFWTRAYSELIFSTCSLKYGLPELNVYMCSMKRANNSSNYQLTSI